MDIKDLVNRVVDGTMSAEELGQMLAARYTVAAVTQNRTDEEVEELARRAANNIVDEFKPNTLEEVIAAYYAGRLTDEQYGTIMRAVTKPKNSTDA